MFNLNILIMKRVLLAVFLTTVSLAAFSQNPYYLGIFTENEYITDNLVYQGDTSFSNWNGWTPVAMGTIANPFYGDTCLALVAGDTWLGWGVVSQDNMDLGDFFDNGLMHLALKVPATSPDTFRVGIKTQNPPNHEFAVFFYGPDLDPYDFKRDDEWHELKIPFKDFVQRDGWLAGSDYNIAKSDLEAMRNPFILGAQNLTTLSFDEVWWAQGTKDPGASSVEDHSLKTFTVYPNPADRFLYLRGNNGYDRVEVFDLTGRTVRSLSFPNITMMEVSDMRPGVYIIRAASGEQEFTCKFIKK